MTKQEMFNLAVRGLWRQNWEVCMNSEAVCIYDDGEGRRCAWGHVDPSLGHDTRTVLNLYHDGIGVAANLSDEDLVFASELQQAHDTSTDDMQRRLYALANGYCLDWPGNVPKP